MQKAILIIGISLAFIFLFVMFFMPFLLPSPIYNFVYGWQYPKQWDIGDGVVTDHGPASSTRRYILTFADVNISDDSNIELNIHSLPVVRLTVGFDIQAKSSKTNLIDAKPNSAIAHLKITNENGKDVIDYSGPLNKWVWSGALIDPSSTFVYARGETRDIPTGEGDIRIELLNVKADGGWGSYFKPRAEGKYTIKLNTGELDSIESIEHFKFVAHGGGWMS